MNGGLIASRYAKALLEFAYERDSADLIYKEMGQVAGNFIKAPEMHRILDNPMLSAEQKEGLLVAAVDDKASDVYRQFVNMVLSNNREAFFHSMAVMYMELYRKRNNINIASLTTATPVRPEVEKKLREKILNYTKGVLEFVSNVDPNILGGFIFEMDFLRLDASSSTQLHKIKENLSSGGSINGAQHDLP